jgi:hypothetical protein
MKANFKSGSVRGVRSNSHPYRDRRGLGRCFASHDCEPRLRMTTTLQSLALCPCRPSLRNATGSKPKMEPSPKI